MNYSTLPFEVKLPEHPILLDVQAHSARVQTVTDRRAARGKRYPLGSTLHCGAYQTDGGQSGA
jgi:hypothetical protein